MPGECGTSGTWPDRPVDRRVVMKAAAAFAAMAVAGRAVRPRRARAAAETRAVRWVEDEHPEIAPDADGFRLVSVDLAFSAVGASWSQEAGDGVLVELQLSADGADWTDPVTAGEASGDAGPPDRDGRRFGQLVFADGARFVRYRTFDPSGAVAPAPGFALLCIDSSDGPVLRDAVGGPGDGAVWRPPIISRDAWGADESYRFDEDGAELWPPNYQTVAHVIIHHTDTPTFRDPLVAIRSIYYYHAVERGWGDIGYNYLVDHMGNVYEGRFGGENVIGGHAYQYAQGSSGIGTLGDFSVEKTTPEAQAGIVWITAWVGRDLDPYGSADFHETRDLPTICGHRDVVESTCPGDGLYGQLDTIRDHVAAVLAGADPTLDPDYFPGDLVAVTVDDGNLREGPGLDFAVLATLPIATMLVVTGGPATVDGYAWYAVTGEAGDGWCAAVILQRQAAPDPAAQVFTVGDWVTVATDALRLRSDAGRSAPAVATISLGTEGEVLDGPVSADGFDWYQLATADVTGWAAGAYLVGAGAPGRFAVGEAVVVDTDALALRSGPGTDRSRLTSMPGGTRLAITGGPVAADGHTWYGVWSNRYGAGWAAGTFLVAAGTGSFGPGQTVAVADGPLALRAAPGFGTIVRAFLPNGTALTVTGGPESADGLIWYPVDSADYGGGWCAGEFLAAT